MDQTPPEVWEKIFSFACTDTGFTGRSLSLVSKNIRETSKSVKFQSIALRGCDQMLAFADLLEKTPFHHRRVRYLFILSRGWDVEAEEDAFQGWYDQNEDFSEEEAERIVTASREESAREFAIGVQKKTVAVDEADRRRREGAIASAFFRILKNVAPSLKIFEVDLDSGTAQFATSIITLPCLTDLTTHGIFPLLPHSHHTPILESCPSLRRLHVKSCSFIVRPSYFLHHIHSFAPALTHLCFSRLQQNSEFPSDLEVALGLTSRKSEAARLPETIERVLIRPDEPPVDGECGTPAVEYDELLEGCRDLQAKDDRVLLLCARAEIQPSDAHIEWLDVVNGGEGCWATDN